MHVLHSFVLPITATGELRMGQQPGGIEINYKVPFNRGRGVSMSEHDRSDVSRIIPDAAGGLGFDVEVPAAPDHYDAKKVILVAKLANRRGRMRFFQSYDGEWFFFKSREKKIAGVDERLEFVRDAEDPLVVSFDDRADARKFRRDTSGIPPKFEEPVEIRNRREHYAMRHMRNDFPPPLEFRRPDGWGAWQGYRWQVMIYASGQAPAQVDTWMRQNIEGRYWVATWVPGSRTVFRLVKTSFRYWRLAIDQWKMVIDEVRDTDRLLIVHFFSKTDHDRFNEAYGPNSLLHRRPLYRR